MNNSSFPTPASLFRGRRVLEWLAAACLMATPLVGPVLLGSSRLWASGPLMALVFLAALLVFLRSLIWRDETTALRAPPGAFAWLGFLAFSTVVIWAYDTPYEARVELLRAASLWAAYWAWSHLIGRDNRWRWVLGLILLAASVNALYGLVNYFQGTPERVLWFDRNAEGASGYAMRISGTYFCPNHWASLLAMLAPVALALVLTPQAGAALRWLAGYALLTFIPAIHVSQSRAGLIGLAAGVGVTVLALVYRRSRAWFALMLVVLPLLMAGGAKAYWEYSPAFKARFLEAVTELRHFQTTGSGGFRLSQWADSLLMIRARPWFGFGPGSYGWVAEEYRQHMQVADRVALYAHDDYLQAVAETGIVGTMLVVIPLAALALTLFRTLRRTASGRHVVLVAGLLGAWAAMLIHALFDFNLRIYANAGVLALLTGVVIGCRRTHRDEGGSRGNAAQGGGRGWAYGAASLTGMLLLVTLWTMTGYYMNLSATHQLSLFHYDDAARLASRAWRLDHENWYAAETLGRVHQMRGRWTFDERQRQADAVEAAQWFERACRGNRRNMETVMTYGLALINHGQTGAGLAQLRRAADTNPMNSSLRTELGLQLRFAGRYAEALAEFQKARKLTNTSMIAENIKWLSAQAVTGKK